MKLWHSLTPWLVLAGATLLGNTAFAQTADEDVAVNAVAACSRNEAPGYAHCTAWVVSDAAGNQKTFATPNGLHPADLISAYKITGSGSSKTTVAIVDAFHYPGAESDLAVYRSTFGLPPCTTANGCFKQVGEHGGKHHGQVDIGWNQEEALDLDMVSAMCPNCKILVVEGFNNSFKALVTAEDTAAAMGAHVISNSYAGGEGGTKHFQSHYDHKGVAITASSDDAGYGAAYPATSPTVTAVGGTVLRADSSARGWNETAWSGAGSGCSAKYKKPSWQTDPLCDKRMESDVSAVASPATGVSVYGPNNSGVSAWMVFGGTSVAAPLIGGIYGEKAGKVNAASTLYAHASNLFDVTSGSNGSCGGTYFCTAGVGYDGPTGLGTPNGDAAFGD